MGRVYAATFEDVSWAGAYDFFEILAPSDACLVIHRCVITQEDDETSQQLPVVFTRGSGSVTSGSGGASVTPAPLHFGDPATGATVERMNSTRLAVGSGTLTVLHREGFNALSGMDYRPTPEERIVLSPGQYLAIGSPNTPSPTLNVSGVLVFEELGG
jgi:hypothetical protein